MKNQQFHHQKLPLIQRSKADSCLSASQVKESVVFDYCIRIKRLNWIQDQMTMCYAESQ